MTHRPLTRTSGGGEEGMARNVEVHVDLCVRVCEECDGMYEKKRERERKRHRKWDTIV